jgi:hypothetical protein
MGITNDLIVDPPFFMCLCYYSKALFDYQAYFALLYMLGLTLALNTTTTSIATFITFLNLDNSIRDYFPNCCYMVVKHMK